MFFFLNDTATTQIYTLSLHDALPICDIARRGDRSARHRATQHDDRKLDRVPSAAAARSHRSAQDPQRVPPAHVAAAVPARLRDRKSTRLNSSHSSISYAVFCLKKKNI